MLERKKVRGGGDGHQNEGGVWKGLILEQESLREMVGIPRGWAGCEAWWEETCALDETTMYGMNTILQTPCAQNPDEEFIDMVQRTFLNCLGEKIS